MPSTRHTVVQSSRLSNLKNGLISPSKRKRILLAAAGAGLSALANYSHAADATWTFGGPASSWSTATAWSTGLAPAPTDNVIFGANGAAGANNTVTNVVDQDFTINSLQYQQRADSSQFHTTQINSGATLIVTGAATGGLAFVVGTQTSDAAGILETWITGAGTLNINSPANDFWVQQGGPSNTTTAPFATLNMSQLANFSANVDEFGVGVGSSNLGGRARGIVTLAQTNNITANVLRISANQSSALGPGSLFFGQNNKVNVGTVLMSERRGIGGMAFAPGVSNGSLTMRGKDGVSPISIFQLGTAVGTDGSNGGGTANFTSAGGNGSGAIDIWTNTLLMGRGAGGRGTASFVFDQGTVRAGEAIIGHNNNVTFSAGTNGQGTFQVQGSGVFKVDGNVTLGFMGAADQKPSAGTLIVGTSAVTGGTANVAGDVLDGLGTSAILINGGTLTARHIGTAANAVDALTVTNGTLGISVGGGGPAANVGTLTADGTNLIKLGIAGPVAVGQQKLIDYASIGGAGFSSFTLDSKLPSRMAATLVDNAGDSIDLNVTASDLPKWNGNLNGNWDVNTTQNWLLANGGTPTTYLEDLNTYSTTDTVLFDDSATGTTTVNLTTNLSPSGVTVNNSAKDYTFSGTGAIVGGSPITKTGSGKLIIANTGANANGVVTVNGGTLQIGDGATAGAGNLGGSIVNNASVVLNRPDNFTFSTPISGTGSLIKVGNNVATVAGASTYTGATVVSAGTLAFNTLSNIGAASPLGAGVGTDNAGNQNSIVLDGTALKFTGSTAQTSNRSFTMGPNGAILDASPTASVGINLNATTLSVATSGTGPRTLTLTGTDFAPLQVASQQIGLVIADQDSTSGQTSVVKNGSTSWRLNGANTYTGGTQINQGRIQAGNATALGGGSVTVADGAQLSVVTGTAPIANAIQISGVGPAEQPGTEAQGNYGALRLAAGSATISGPVTLTGDARVTGRSSGSFGGFLTGQITGAHALEFGNTGGGQGTVTISSTANDWSGNTTISHGVLKLGAAGVIPSGAGKGNVVINNTSATNDSILDLNGFDQTINGLSSAGTDMTRVKVTNNGGSSNTLSVGANNAGGSYAGQVLNGAGTVAITKVGTGSQTLSGNNSYTGVTTVTAGKLILANNAKNPALTGAGGADIQGGRLVLDYNDTGVAPDVKSILTAGFAQTPKFSSGQIRTSNAADSAKGLGWVDNATAKQETVGYTYYGDANLDGQVDVTDLGALATSWQTSNVWAGGDFNYDGFVDVTDLGALATNWQQGVGNPLGKGSLEAAMQSVGLGNVSVPEPTTISIIGLAAIGFASRRRRRA